MEYSIVEQVPSAEAYCDIRIKTGLSPRTLETAKESLPKTIYGVSLINAMNNELVGMGRIIGDGCFWYIVDICVIPQCQKQGLGKLIMTKLMDHVNNYAPKDCDVILLAIKDAKYLYAQYGFQPTHLMGTISMRYHRP